MHQPTLYWLSAMGGMNLLSFCLFGLDKHRARRNQWRIPENTLLLCAFLGGSWGSWLGMLFFRHKTRHIKFRLLVPMCVLLQTGLVLWLLWRSFGENIF